MALQVSAGLSGAVPGSSLYTLGEEIAHAATHGFGVLLAVAGLTVLVAYAALYGTALHVVSCAIFGATLVLNYTASTLFHSIPLPRVKHVLRIIDHSMIYFLIAGTYTPFALVTLHGPLGWSLFLFVWGLTAAGVVFKIFATGKYESLSLVTYVAMGWCFVVALEPLSSALGTEGMALLVAGGLSYTGGIVFYLWERLRYHHAIWHVFVLAGSVLHYFTILLYVVPGPHW